MCLSGLTGKPHPWLCSLVCVILQGYAYNREDGGAHTDLDSIFKSQMGAKSGPNPSLDRNSQCSYHRHLALVSGNWNFREFSSQIDLDLAISKIFFPGWRAMLTPSQRELTPHNWRKSDLCFLKQGGLCMALGETCSFYANQSGYLGEILSWSGKPQRKGRKET